MEKLDKIRDGLKEKYGNVDRDYQEWLFEDAKEPWGFVQKANSSRAGNAEGGKSTATGKTAPQGEGIVEIMARWDLVDDNGKLKPKKFLKDGFPELAKEMEEHGYKYNKNAGGFLPAWKGVKQ
ncbi:MAG: hypothetical protein QXU18_09150 [Thermoplasmatales archaeon]